MNKILIASIVLASLWGIEASLAQKPQSQEEGEGLFNTPPTPAAQYLDGVVACDAINYPVLYYVPVEEMRCEIPGGYGINFEGTFELADRTLPPQSSEQWVLFVLH
ncbi:hypothetical protein IQ249_21395 [Lusitaniella coriacea LEGE 07157]|uniref:Uncharacterized protein n=1 Tax=Lusitaniella coriacea LEGE 07157 TaxID=945747 RepID=A0A8J7E2F2_9CYAN|nr:hypothetical protein [Lusitaniella coriacea]MBE9118451.1 hypothetical protein [Lusitaniella coriacea LEGE 07157]